MSKWAKVGDWLKDNAADGVGLVGSLLTGNVKGAIAAGAALVSSATGKNDPDAALAHLQSNPEALIRLKELAYQNEQHIRSHIEAMELARIQDVQLEHSETQKTIRAGDASNDEKIRMVRPTMAKQSWLSTIVYCLGCFGVHAIIGEDLFNSYIAVFLSSPAWAYLGLRTTDKLVNTYKSVKEKK